MSVRRQAMTLIEVLIALAILAIIAAVVVPTTAGQLRQGHSTALANQLTNLRSAIANYRENVGAYPISLTQLTTQPIAGDTDSCTANLSNAELNAWRGPYVNQNIVGAMPVGNAAISTALTRTTISGATGDLQIVAMGVDNDIALALEQQFDGNNNLNTGNITWTTANNGTLVLHIPIRGC
ncbi:MAG TPA: prepilin-type N-terminal cleavage/methylation domain-containing protein [Gemmatimonadaceae bacterium]|nr:prepilin-type N-terminal cleavage/methylation domain-containing protein [Gemmatimonadaceae bacterium]